MRFLSMIFAFTLLPIALHAQTTTVANPAYANMQRVVGGVIQNVAVNRGFSTTDPRTYGTLYGWGKAAAAGVAGAGTGAVVVGTSPAWGTVLLAAAVSAGVGYAVNVAIDGSVKWLFGPGATPVTYIVISPIGTSMDAGALFVQSGSACDPNVNKYLVANLFGNCAANLGKHNPLCMNSPPFTCSDASYVACPGQSFNTAQFCAGGGDTGTVSGINTALASLGYKDKNGVVGGTTIPTTTVPSQTMAQAVTAIPASSLTQPVDYGAIALMINSMWQQAAQQPGYAGLPYIASQPVQASDVQAYATANPSAYPTVQALVAPVTDTSTGFAPSTSTSTGTALTPATTSSSPTATNPTASGTTINLGADPGIGTPTLESTPTAQMILNPLLSLFPDLKAYSVPGHTGTCPQPTFQVFSTSITMTQHCTLFEGQRAALYAIMLVSFTLVALFIVLSA